MASEKSSDLSGQQPSTSSTLDGIASNTDVSEGVTVQPDRNIERSRAPRAGEDSSYSKTGIVLALLAVILTLGQYYQNWYDLRNGTTEIWREGYPDETRDRVARFTLHYKRWKESDSKAAINSLDNLIKPENVFDGKILRSDKNLKTLLDYDFEDDGKERTDKQYVDVALKYRNAIIGCLNTIEAVESVIQARPLWMHLFGNASLLEDRYEDLIKQRTQELQDFIDRYRLANQRDTPAWIGLNPRKFYEKLPYPEIIVGVVILYLLGRHLRRRRITVK